MAVNDTEGMVIRAPTVNNIGRGTSSIGVFSGLNASQSGTPDEFLNISSGHFAINSKVVELVQNDLKIQRADGHATLDRFDVVVAGSRYPRGESENSQFNVHGNNWIAQSFSEDAAFYTGLIRLKLQKTGSPTGDLTYSIQGDSSGEPDGSDIVSGTLDSSTLTTSEVEVVLPFTSSTLLSASTTYWLVVRLSGGDGSNHVKVSYNSTSNYANGSKSTSTDAGSNWTNQSTEDCWFQVIPLGIVQGTASADPDLPSIPSNHIPLYVLDVQATDTTVNDAEVRSFFPTVTPRGMPAFTRLFGGDGSDGAKNVTASTSISYKKIWQYTSLTIDASQTLSITETGPAWPLIILVSGNATINGTLDLQGKGGQGTRSSLNGIDIGLPIMGPFAGAGTGTTNPNFPGGAAGGAGITAGQNGADAGGSPGGQTYIGKYHAFPTVYPGAGASSEDGTVFGGSGAGALYMEVAGDFTISSTGSINANGGTPTAGGNDRAGGGAGAIWVRVRGTIINEGSATAVGGTGSSGGGNGGNGVVIIEKE